MEALARSVLEALCIHSASGKHSLVLGGEVFPDHGNHANLGEVTCGEREIGCRAAQAPVTPPCGASILSNATLPTTRMDMDSF